MSKACINPGPYCEKRDGGCNLLEYPDNCIKAHARNVVEDRRHILNESGKKFDDKKQRWDLLPMNAVAEAVKRFTHGAEKYEPNNWQKVENPIERYYGALLRHLAAWRAGEEMDPDVPELTHLSAVLWNALVLVWFELND